MAYDLCCYLSEGESYLYIILCLRKESVGRCRGTFKRVYSGILGRVPSCKCTVHVVSQKKEGRLGKEEHSREFIQEYLEEFPAVSVLYM